jgi:hypothetical protein
MTQSPPQYQFHAFFQDLLTTQITPATVTLHHHDPSIPLPDPELIRLHFQIAQILDTSGIRQKLEEACQEDDRTPSNPASDGSTNLERVLSLRMHLQI